MAETNFFLFWAVCSINLLTFNTASTFSWTSPAIPKLKSNDSTVNPIGHSISSSEESLLASLPVLGSMLGSIISGIVAEKLGRKKALIICSLPFVIGFLITANSSNITYYYVTRLVMGVSGGCIISVLPSYVGEISEDSNRGSLGNLFGIMMALGHLMSFAIGPLLNIATYSYILMIPASLFLTCIYFIPESPYYFLSKNDKTKAIESLKKLRSNGNFEKELLSIEKIIKDIKADKVTLKDITSSAATRKGLLVCSGLLFFQVGLGIAVVMIYLQPILNAGGSLIPSYRASVIIGAVQTVSCLGTSFVIDRLGRKMLLYLSSGGSSLSLFALGTFFLLNENHYNVDLVSWLPVASLITYCISFNLGFGVVPWIISGELFTPNVKSFCTSVATCVNITAAFLCTLSFPFLRDAFGMGGVFYVFSGLAFLASIFVFLFVPETKGKSFQEIQDELNSKQKLIDDSQHYDSS